MYSYIFSLAALGLAHCCTVFIKSSGYQNIDDIDDRHRNLCKYQYQRDHLVGQSTTLGLPLPVTVLPIVRDSKHSSHPD